MTEQATNYRCTAPQEPTCKGPCCSMPLSGKQKDFHTPDCKNAYFSLARQIGVRHLERERRQAVVSDSPDLDTMTPQERQGALCAAAVRSGVMR